MRCCTAWAAWSTGIVDQWTIDEDANQAYYPDASGWYPRSDDMTDPLLSAANQAGDTVWLGLANVSAWQSHAGDAKWLSNQLYVQEQTADQLYKLFAASVKNVLGGFDVIDVQDSGGSGYEQPSDITNWFTALHQALAGTSSALWDDPDLFSAGNHGGPMTPAQLQANLKAAYGQVSAYSGFSFTTQLDPNLIGTSSYYNAYQAYEKKQS